MCYSHHLMFRFGLGSIDHNRRLYLCIINNVFHWQLIRITVSRILLQSHLSFSSFLVTVSLRLLTTTSFCKQKWNYLFCSGLTYRLTFVPPQNTKQWAWDNCISVGAMNQFLPKSRKRRKKLKKAHHWGTHSFLNLQSQKGCAYHSPLRHFSMAIFRYQQFGRASEAPPCAMLWI